jgi:hypothetical protein
VEVLTVFTIDPRPKLWGFSFTKKTSSPGFSEAAFGVTLILSVYPLSAIERVKDLAIDGEGSNEYTLAFECVAASRE